MPHGFRRRAKTISKNRLTLPTSVVQSVGATECFDVEARDGQIVLTAVRIQRGDAVRAKIAALGLGAADVADAVNRARTAVASLHAIEPVVECAARAAAGKVVPKKRTARRK